MSSPLVSIVMSVYNDSSRVGKTIESLLNQTYQNLEFIIINDGSNDSTQEILESYAARDDRISLIYHTNQGLTQSLIQGCQQAQGRFIARQDSGDLSLPHRTEQQVHTLLNNPRLALVSSYTQYITTEGEQLYREANELTYSPQNCQPTGFINFLMPPHHGSVLFPKDFYFQVGGYRSQFYFAQDCDLWSRLIELGGHQIISEALYIAEFNISSISGQNSLEQQQLRTLIEKSTQARRAGQSESTFLEQASLITQSKKQSFWGNRKRLARSHYFIGSCLLRQNSTNAKKYFAGGVLENPLHWRCWIKLLQSLLT